MLRSVWWFAALTAIVAIVCFAFARTTSRAPFGYDEADYMYAGTQGFAANYLDRGSMGLNVYLSKGLDLLRDRSQRESLSRLVRNSGGIDFYRHYHGPVYAYWLALAHAAGARQESAYRASGLVLQALGSLIIFLMFRRVFPELPVAAAFVAAVTFAMNRTALVAATTITQHVVFGFLACCSLFALAEFLRTGRERYWYAAAALVALSFAAVEIASVMIASVIGTVAWFERQRGLKSLAGLFLRGAGVFVAVLAIVWPAGVFRLNALKGYMYLAYMAVGRKTFTPIGPLELWGFKLRIYPAEFVLLFAAIVAGVVWLWRTKNFRRAAPFLIYGIVFLAVTMVITAPYTYYHVSLTMSLSVVTGVVFGELWNRTNGLTRAAALLLVLASLAWLDLGYYRETEHRAKPAGTADVLAYIDSRQLAGPLFLPFEMVPPMHFYHPEIVANGYDATWTGQALADQASELKQGTTVFCSPEVCRQLDSGAAARAERIGALPDTQEPLYAMKVGTR
jgi:hypothetical protein